MESKLSAASINDFFISKRYFDQSRINALRNWGVNTAFPCINSLLGAQRISLSEAVYDETTLSLGNTPHHFLRICYQSINEDQSITDISGLVDLDITACIELLNLLNIRIPFIKGVAENVMKNKFYIQNIPAKSIYSDSIQRYTDKIQIIALFEDTVKFKKDFPILSISEMLNDIYNSIDYSDMSTQIPDYSCYDLSSLYYCSTSGVISQDLSENTLLSAQINDLSSYIYDFTNINISQFDNTAVILAQDIVNTEYIKSVVIPVQSRFVLSGEVPLFYQTTSDNLNEYIPARFSIPYGDYIYSILKGYYDFSDSVILLIIKLVLAQVARNASDDLNLAEINELMGLITGVEKSTGYTSIIKEIEDDLSTALTDITGYSQPVIYHDENMNNSTDQTMHVTQNVSDVYDIIAQLNKVTFVFMLDFGYDGNLIMGPMHVIASKDQAFPDTGYLSMFTTINQIEL